MAPHTVRTAIKGDVPVLVTLMTHFYAESDFPLPADAAGRTFEALIADPRLGRVFLMEAGGRSAGFAVLTVGFSMEYGGLRGFVDDFFVHPDFRGQGVGAAALRELQRVGKVMGVRALLVEVGPENAPALGVYRRHGFSDSGHLLLVKPLASPVHDG